MSRKKKPVEPPSHCERCGERPTNVQIYPLVKVGDDFICSRHDDYPRKQSKPDSREPDDDQ
jgi:hypothetical protein